MSKITDIGLQLYRDKKMRVFGKKLVPLAN